MSEPENMLAVQEKRADFLARIDSDENWCPRSLGDGYKLAEVLSRSGLVPRALAGKPSDVFLILMTGHEFGMSPTAALRSVHVINGMPSMSADARVAIARRSGEVKYFDLVKSDATEATYTTMRKRASAPATMTFTAEDVRRAGLAGKDNHKNYTAAMLRARCKSALVTAVYGDLLTGIAATEELQAIPAEPDARAEEVAATIRRVQERAAKGLGDQGEEPAVIQISPRADFASIGGDTAGGTVYYRGPEYEAALMESAGKAGLDPHIVLDYVADRWGVASPRELDDLGWGEVVSWVKMQEDEQGQLEIPT